MASNNEKDFCVWANEQAALQRARRRDGAERDPVAGESDGIGRGEEGELINRLAVLLLDLLKWRFQPGFRSSSGSSSIRAERIRLRGYLKDNPGLKDRLRDSCGEAYQRAVIAAARETGLPENAFPNAAPFRVEQAVDDGFWP